MSISLDFARKIVNELIEHKNWLGDRKAGVSQVLFDRYCSYAILSVFKGKPDDQKDFLNSEIITKFISTFSDNDIDIKQEIRSKIDLLLDFKEIITENVPQAIITKLQALLSAENQKAYREEKENFLTCIDDILDSFREQFANISDINILNSFAASIVEGIDTAEKWPQKKIFIYSCLGLFDICRGDEKSNLDERIRDFFSNADLEDVRFVLNKYKNDTARKELLNKYQSIFQQRVIAQQPFLDLLYPVATEDVRAQWLSTLINGAPARAFAKLEELSYKVDFKKNIVEALLTKVQLVPAQEKGIFYVVINKMECANDAELEMKLTSQIKELLKTDDLLSQQAGYSALMNGTYLPASLKREIAREVVERLRLLPPEQAGRHDPVKSVLLNWSLLEPPVKRDFLDFVFDKLIKRGASINDISFGIEILFTTKPRYEDYPQYFDDVFSRAEAESDPQIKSAIVGGLNRLKPPKTTKRSGGYWAKVTNLKQGNEESENNRAGTE